MVNLEVLSKYESKRDLYFNWTNEPYLADFWDLLIQEDIDFTRIDNQELENFDLYTRNFS